MANQSNSAAEFYRQLALLLKSGMPLPESIRSLEPGLNSRAFREAVDGVSRSIDSGKKLSEAMRSFPNVFQKQYVEMIEVGEDSGTLAATMAEIGQTAYTDYKIVKLFRDILFYPVLVILLLIAVFIGMNYLVIYPSFKPLFDELFEGYYRSVVFDFSVVIHEYILFFVAGFLVLVAACIWFLSGKGKSTSILIMVVPLLPGFERIFKELLNARLCMFWSMLLKRKLPEKKIFPLLQLCIDNKAVQHDLKMIDQTVQNGTPVKEAMEKAPDIASTIKLTFRHVPEERIAEELEVLSQLYLEQAVAKLRTTAIAYEAALTVMASLAILLFILIMLAPLGNLIHTDDLI